MAKPINPLDFLRIVHNPDGSLTRLSPFPTLPATPSPSPSAPALSKDVPLHPPTNTFLRIFKPHAPIPLHTRLPVLFYFHGGGFVLFSASSAPFHDKCARLAASLPALVLSLEYRLAPEHRLPAAYDDAHLALRWLSRQATLHTEPWLEHADFSHCFLMGSSSGANIAYRTALRVLGEDLSPVRVCGLILNQPYFGGVERTESEMRLAGDKVLPLAANDLLWSLALPRGVDRDHEFSNPMVKIGPEIRQLARTVVIGFAGDPLIDRQRKFVEMLKEHGVDVATHFDGDADGTSHGVDLFEEEKAKAIFDVVSEFVWSFTSSDGNVVAKSTL